MNPAQFLLDHLEQVLLLRAQMSDQAHLVVSLAGTARRTPFVAFLVRRIGLILRGMDLFVG
jgi:hypothetical protein